MFGKLFGSKQQEKKEPQMDPKTAALINAIRERSKEDPLIGAKLGAKEVFQRPLHGMKDSKGVHVESPDCIGCPGWLCMPGQSSSASLG